MWPFSKTKTLILDHIPKPEPMVKFEPKEDITAYELAQLMKTHWLFRKDTKTHNETLPENLRRHFVDS